jgi:GNAT superfamily N-acetyltransferase
MLSFISLWNYRPQPTPLLLDDFKEKRYVDTYNSFPPGSDTAISKPSDKFVYGKPGGVLLEYYNKKDVKIGYIRYYVTTGQIGMFFIDKEYQNRGLGKQILSKVICELKENFCDEVWVVTTDNHPFWSNVFSKSFTPGNPAHPIVTGSGYFMRLYTNEKLI